QQTKKPGGGTRPGAKSRAAWPAVGRRGVERRTTIRRDTLRKDRLCRARLRGRRALLAWLSPQRVPVARRARSAVGVPAMRRAGFHGTRILADPRGPEPRAGRAGRHARGAARLALDPGR